MAQWRHEPCGAARIGGLPLAIVPLCSQRYKAFENRGDSLRLRVDDTSSIRGGLGVFRMLCGMIGHRVDRAQVRAEGTHFRTDCERCGAPLIRRFAGWRLFDDALEGQD